MRKIIYYVATSIDGFISGANEDISGFVAGGAGVNQYLQDIQAFDTVIMGRKTYEFGYAFGLEPGQPAYPHMDHYIFSKTIQLPQLHPKVKICDLDLSIIKNLQKTPGSDIYLCGGGTFAGWLLENEMIDVVKIKLNPLILGKGVRLFKNNTKKFKLDRISADSYEDGLEILSYEVKY